DPARTPGGSSSGSAAAVAAGMVPLTLGTQTNGSVIRPASYCGVWGFKPSKGLIPRHGILQLSSTLDTVGVFARSLDDIALVTEQLVGHDDRDADTHPRARPPLREAAVSEPPLPPRLGFVQTAAWPRADASTRDAFAELVAELGADCETIELPPSLDEAADWLRTIMEAEMALNLDAEWQRGRSQLSQPLAEQLERGRAITALQYQQARARIPRIVAGFEETFARVDALVTPATIGTAPPLAGTGDPAFCSLWSLAGMPALSMPLMHGADGLPLGIQLVGQREGDAKLLRTAHWLQRRLHVS
ncbi:MAG TPA: amidase, partial [Burkholderiaceae bacterium]